MEWLSTLLRSFARPFQWWVTIAPWERGLRIRLGKVAAELLPGIHFRVPFLDRVYVQSIRLRTLWKSNQTISSRDGKTLVLSIAIDFQVEDIRRMFDSLSSPEITLALHAQALIAEYVSSLGADSVNPVNIEIATNAGMADFGSGLCDIHIRVTDFAFVPTYRLLINDYQTNAGLGYDFDGDSKPGGAR